MLQITPFGPVCMALDINCSNMKFSEPAAKTVRQSSSTVLENTAGYADVTSMITRLQVMEKIPPPNCTRLGSIPRLGASPITKPTRHHELPTTTMAMIPNASELKNGMLPRNSAIALNMIAANHFNLLAELQQSHRVFGIAGSVGKYAVFIGINGHLGLIFARFIRQITHFASLVPGHRDLEFDRLALVT